MTSMSPPPQFGPCSTSRSDRRSSKAVRPRPSRPSTGTRHRAGASGPPRRPARRRRPAHAGHAAMPGKARSASPRSTRVGQRLAVDHARDAAPAGCGLAHTAGARGRNQQARREVACAQSPRRVSDGFQLSMCSGIRVGDHAATRSAHNGLAAQHHRPEGLVPCAQRLVSKLLGAAHRRAQGRVAGESRHRQPEECRQKAASAENVR